MIRGGLSVLFLAASAADAEPLTPAEFPPAEYGGLQYVDSKGCLFARAGRGGEVLWIPRVSREGAPVCGYPPSGQRVMVVEEVGVQPVPAPAAGEASGDRVAEPAGGYFVAVGSYGDIRNADKAQARLSDLKYGVVRGRVQGGSGTLITVFAGPFPDEAAAVAARQALRDAGFADATLIRP